MSDSPRRHCDRSVPLAPDCQRALPAVQVFDLTSKATVSPPKSISPSESCQTSHLPGCHASELTEVIGPDRSCRGVWGGGGLSGRDRIVFEVSPLPHEFVPGFFHPGRNRISPVRLCSGRTYRVRAGQARLPSQQVWIAAVMQCRDVAAADCAFLRCRRRGRRGIRGRLP